MSPRRTRRSGSNTEARAHRPIDALQQHPRFDISTSTTPSLPLLSHTPALLLFLYGVVTLLSVDFINHHRKPLLSLPSVTIPRTSPPVKAATASQGHPRLLDIPAYSKRTTVTHPYCPHNTSLVISSVAFLRRRG